MMEFPMSEVFFGHFMGSSSVFCFLWNNMSSLLYCEIGVLFSFCFFCFYSWTWSPYFAYDVLLLNEICFPCSKFWFISSQSHKQTLLILLNSRKILIHHFSVTTNFISYLWVPSKRTVEVWKLYPLKDLLWRRQRLHCFLHHNPGW